MEDNSIIAIIGAITGTVSLGIIIYKTWREKPRISITLEKTYWSIHTKDDPVFNPISINVRADNKGNFGTTIHSISILFDQNGKSHNVPIDHHTSIDIPPHGSIRKLLSFTIKRDEIKIENDIINAKLIMKYTHGQKQIDMPVIKEWE